MVEFLPVIYPNFELTATNGCGDIDVQSYFVRAKSAKLTFWPFLSFYKIVFFPSHTSILAEVTHVYANIHIPKFHTCQLSHFTVMVVQSFKKCKFFNKNYCENFSKKLKKKFSSGFLSWENKIISNFLDPPPLETFF